MTHIFLKTAWGYMRRSPFQAIAAVIVLGITFFVATILAVLVYSSNQVLKYYEARPQVIAFIKEEVPPESVTALKENLVADSRLKEVKYVSKEEALEIYKEATSDKPLLTELVSPSIFPASLEFSIINLSDVENVMNEVRSNEVVDEVCFTVSLDCDEDSLPSIISRIKQISKYIRLGGGGFVGMQLIASFLVLIIIIMMRLSVRKKEIEILDLIGATPGFIRSPIIIEALLYGVFGVFVGWIAALTLVLYATPSVISYFGEIQVLPRNTFDLLYLFGLVLIIELIIALFLTFGGGVFAVGRARKRTQR